MSTCQVAVNYPIFPSILTYQIPTGDQVAIGETRKVPLGKRTAFGLVIGINSDSEAKNLDFEIKELQETVEQYPTIDSKNLELFQWMSSYYHYPLGKLIYDALPKAMKEPRPYAEYQGEGRSLPDFVSRFDELIAGIAICERTFHQFLIHGVTGSGKSFIMLRLIQEVLNTGKSVQYLIPEINLTPQFLGFFQEFLKAPIHLYHSELSHSQKLGLWQKAASGERGPALFIGVRSSIFLPIEDVGLILVDEEHDSSFKQQDRCSYQARDVAIKKASLFDVPVVLASATPTVETHYKFSSTNADDRTLISLTERLQGELPEIDLHDYREHQASAIEAGRYPLDEVILEKIQKAVAKNEQVLIFLNKLGYAQWVQCRQCGHSIKNDQCGCDLNLRYFKRKNILSCAHCTFQRPLPPQCPACGCLNFLPLGMGTERVEEVLKKELPHLAVARFDRDQITTFKQLKKTLDDFHEHKTDVLVGTQMLSKGHNFSRVNLVVVLGIDALLQYPDFRGQEKAYQLLTQISGRAGRFAQGGKVLVQTLCPEKEFFQWIKQNRQDLFYGQEKSLRELIGLPPFARLSYLYLSGKNAGRTIEFAKKLAENLRKSIQYNDLNVVVHGPNPCSIERKAGQTSWYLALRSQDVKSLHALLKATREQSKAPPGVALQFDVDPWLAP